MTVIEEQNRNLTLNCTVNGNPTPDVKWTKDGIDISENQGISVSNFSGDTSSLTIINIVRGDEGQYRCVANNSVNITTSSPGKLTVNCEYYFQSLSLICDLKVLCTVLLVLVNLFFFFNLHTHLTRLSPQRIGQETCCVCLILFTASA